MLCYNMSMSQILTEFISDHKDTQLLVLHLPYWQKYGVIKILHFWHRYYLLINQQYLIMTNPFAVFDVSDDEQDSKAIVVKKDDKPKLTHAQKRAYKKQKEQNEKKAAEIVRKPAQEPLPSKTKESHKYPHMERQKKQWKQKEVPSGHTQDRRSGTGREDRPRKAGGGYGNVGNAKDQVNQDKYVKDDKAEDKPVEEVTEPVQEKEPQPEKLTLEEYYKAKGVDVTYQREEKAPVKKEDIKAEWIKKEKLTLMTTKEDRRGGEDRKTQQNIQQNSSKVGLGIEEADFDKVGFGSKPAPREAPRQEEPQKGGKRGGKKNKPQFSADDFPSL